MSGKGTKRKSTPRTQPKPPSKKFKADLAKLQEWTSTDPTREALNQGLQSNFKDRTIAQSRTAMKAQDLSQTILIISAKCTPESYL